MLFTSPNPIPQSMAVAITRAVHAQDEFAQVRVDVSSRQIRIDGRLSAQQAVAALSGADCDAELTHETTDAGHASRASTCCGGCS